MQPNRENSRSFHENLSAVISDDDKTNDLVLSVFKLPVKDPVDNNPPPPCVNSDVQIAQNILGASEELLIADDLATETTAFTTASVSPGRLSFFKRMRTPKPSHPTSPAHKQTENIVDPVHNAYCHEAKKSLGIPHPYYPIALPIDQAFKAKYASHHRKSRTIQERIYAFLEHPCGYLCIIYHLSV